LQLVNSAIAESESKRRFINAFGYPRQISINDLIL